MSKHLDDATVACLSHYKAFIAGIFCFALTDIKLVND